MLFENQSTPSQSALSETGGLYSSRFFCARISVISERATEKEVPMGHVFAWKSGVKSDFTSQIVSKYSDRKWSDLIKLLRGDRALSSPEETFIKAVLCDDGFIGFPQSTPRAIRLHQDAMRNGCPYSEAYLISLFLSSEYRAFGYITEADQDIEKISNRLPSVIDLLMSLSNDNDHEATAALGELLLVTQMEDHKASQIPGTYSNAIREALRKAAAEEGSAVCAGYVSSFALLDLSKRGAFFMTRELFDWLLFAHKLGDDYSSIALGYYLYNHGENDGDADSGGILIYNAAKNGNVAAHMTLGKILVRRTAEDESDLVEFGLEYLLTGAEFGSPRDKFEAGQFFDPRRPKCVQPNPSIAARLYESASMAGFPGLGRDVAKLRRMNGSVQ